RVVGVEVRAGAAEVQPAGVDAFDAVPGRHVDDGDGTLAGVVPAVVVGVGERLAGVAGAVAVAVGERFAADGRGGGDGCVGVEAVEAVARPGDRDDAPAGRGGHASEDAIGAAAGAFEGDDLAVGAAGGA